MNNITKMIIWGRELTLDIVYQLFDHKEPTELQIAAWDEFQKQNVSETALEPLKQYILSHEGKEKGIEQIDNIFKYVKPISIFIPRSKEKVAAIICDYKLDPEHGIALVFKNNELSEIGAQDIIL